MLLKRTPEIASSEITDERLYVKRREFMRIAATAAVAAAAAAAAGVFGRSRSAHQSLASPPRWIIRRSESPPVRIQGKSGYRRRETELG